MRKKRKKSQPSLSTHLSDRQTTDQPKVKKKQLKEERKRQKREEKQRRKEEKRERKRNRSLPRKIFKWFSCSFLFLFIIGLIVSLSFVSIVYSNYKQEFSLAEPKSQISSNIFYDKNGEVIYETFGAKKPTPIELSNLPEDLIKATIAIEDKDFYNHGAFDAKAIVRAAYVNFKASDSTSIKGRVLDIFDESNVVEGGSTITQQLVKNVYLTPEKSIERKAKELVYAVEMERKYSKDEILEMYFNQIYYGEQSIGIYNAAQNYFGKTPDELNLAECTVLAGLPAAPSKYSPLSGNFEEAKSRQAKVLEKMYETGYLTEKDAKETINIPLEFNPSTKYTIKYPYFVNYIKEELRSMYGDEVVEEGGLQVYTTIDPVKQEIAERKAKEYVNKFKGRNVSNAGVVIMDPKTNEVSAMVGGIDWETSKYNVALADRQPGSSFKPVVYATGFKEGFTAASILLDTPISFPGNPPYRPRNYNGSYWGNVTIRTALANSLNIPAVEMLKLVGIDSALETAHDMGITTLNDKDRYGLSLVLGGGEVKLLDMASVYATFADNGKEAETHGIEKVIDKNEKVIYQFDRQKKQALDSRHAYIITNILSDNKTRSRVFGSNSPLRLSDDRPTAVKTGTTDNYTDSWTMGYTPDLVVGVWMGNNDHSSMKVMSGIEGAAYVWHDIMEECLKNTPAKGFEKPEGIEEVWINPYSGLPTNYQGWSSILEVFVEGTVPKKQDLSYLNEFRYNWKNY